MERFISRTMESKELDDLKIEFSDQRPKFLVCSTIEWYVRESDLLLGAESSGSQEAKPHRTDNLFGKSFMSIQKSWNPPSWENIVDWRAKTIFMQQQLEIEF